MIIVQRKPADKIYQEKIEIRLRCSGTFYKLVTEHLLICLGCIYLIRGNQESIASVYTFSTDSKLSSGIPTSCAVRIT